RRIAVDRPALGAGGLFLLVDRRTDHVPEPAEGLVADGNGDRLAGVDDVEAAPEAVRGVHRDGSDTVVAEMLLHLRDQLDRLAAVLRRNGDAKRRVDLRQAVREDGVDHDTLDLEDLADVLFRVCHVETGSPEEMKARPAPPRYPLPAERIAGCRAPPTSRARSTRSSAPRGSRTARDPSGTGRPSRRSSSSCPRGRRSSTPAAATGASPCRSRAQGTRSKGSTSRRTSSTPRVRRPPPRISRS